MRCSHEIYDRVCVLTVQGDILSDHAAALKAQVEQDIEQQGVHDVVLELADVEFIDSQGLETMLWIQDACAEKLGQVRLAATQENVDKILEITRLASRFDTHPDVETAMRSLR